MSAFQTVFADGTILPGYTGKIIISDVSLTIVNGVYSGGYPLVNGQDNVWNSLDFGAGDSGLWLVGGSNVGIFSTTHNSVISTYHADHNDLGSSNIRTSPGGGSVTAMHLTSNHPNGYIFPQGMRPYIITGPKTINFVMQPGWSGGSCVAYGVAMGIKLF
jgi:hypothetical protein